jgi:pimeloyl-ACP methyl ester carboxylesterase
LLTPDAVVVVPGIMGSELRDTETGSVIWGLRPSVLVAALAPGGDGISRLAVTEDVGRVEPVGLLRFPTHLPWLSGLEPYSRLTARLKGVVRRADAVAEFAYDWRLPVAYNARLLAELVAWHVAAWRAASGCSDARVVLVAHSMGGLVCQAMAGIPGAADDVRATVTLGTPFDGAAKVALMLAGPAGDRHGSGVDRVRRELAAVARSMPGVYDLLPGYRCLDTGDDVRTLDVGDVAALGGDRDHATTAEAHRAARQGLRLPGHHALIGVEQPTVSSLRIDAGAVSGTRDTFQPHPDGELVRDEHDRLVRFPGHGDATVPRNSALPRENTPMVLGQQHTTLAHSDEAITFVLDVVVHGRAPDHPRLGDGAAGLVVPDLVALGEEWTGELTGLDPYRARVTISGPGVDRAPLSTHRRGEETAGFTASVWRPGLYRIEVQGGATPVAQYVMAVP